MSTIGWQCPSCKVCYPPDIRECRCAVNPLLFPFPSRPDCNCTPEVQCGVLTVRVGCPRRMVAT